MTEQSPTMDTEELPQELERALEKAKKNNNRAIRAEGYGASDLGLELTKGNLWVLVDYIKDRFEEPINGNSTASGFLRVATDLGAELTALCALQGLIHCVAKGGTPTATYEFLGEQIAAECWAMGLTRHDPKLAERLSRQAKLRHGSTKSRRAAVKRAAARAYEAADWSADLKVHAGAWLVDCCLAALPHLFAWGTVPGEHKDLPVITLQPDALAAAEQVVGEMILQRPVHLPRIEAPKPWDSWKMVSHDPRVSFNTTFLRTPHKDVAAAAKAAIRDGSMQPALDAVNALQAVPWAINTRILEIVEHCRTHKIEVSSLPTNEDVPSPVAIKPWEAMDNDERTLWMMENREADLQNSAVRNERLMMVQDMKVAEQLSQVERFWTPMNLDWRGRVYALCHFNFQREDRVRALFQFADGEPIGEEGLRWLKIHVANCGAFDKIDKKPMEERIAWVDENIWNIRATAKAPLDNIDWWRDADSPFLFVAACIELDAALVFGPSYVTRIPCSFDGSCSGLQHLSAMTRDESTAALVNLLPANEPQDVYNTIALRVSERVKADLMGETAELARLVVAYGIDRKLSKRNVMTYSYSSKKFGMASQQQVDLIDTLQKKVLQKKLAAHPFAPYHRGSKERPGKAARYIAGHVFASIEERIHLPALAMKFLQGLAKALAHEGKPLRWTSPVGIPWVNRYHEHRYETLSLWMHDKGVRKNMRVQAAVGFEPEILKDKAANGVAPNFVHALDGSHLLLAANASVAEGITNIATVHDSFGCLASQAARFNKIIRIEMVRMYETHDVLSEVLEQAKCDLTQHNWDRLPPVPQYGNLNLKEIENAPYAFA